MRRLRDDEVFKLIELYKKNECLWNSADKNYKQKSKRIEAYTRIKDAMNLSTIAELKQKIKACRDTYSSEREKMNGPPLTGSHPDIVYKTKLCWFNLADSFFRDIDRIKKDEPRMMPDQIKNRSIFFNQNADGSEYCSRVVRSETHPGYPTQASKKMISKHCQTKFDTEMKADADEFYHFGMNVALQLKMLPLVKALHLQARFQQILCEERIASVRERSTSVSCEEMDQGPFTCEASCSCLSPVEVKLEPGIDGVTNCIPSNDM